MSDAVVSVFVLGMSPLDPETCEVTKSSYLPRNIQNTMVKQGLDSHKGQSYSERERMKGTPGPDISQGRSCCWLKVWNILWIGPDFAILGLVLVHSFLWLLPHPLGSFTLDPLKRTLQNRQTLLGRWVHLLACFSSPEDWGVQVSFQISNSHSLLILRLMFLFGLLSWLLFDSKLHPSKVILTILFRDIPLSFSRFNFSHLDSIRLWWENYIFIYFSGLSNCSVERIYWDSLTYWDVSTKVMPTVLVRVIISRF